MKIRPSKIITLLLALAVLLLPPASALAQQTEPTLTLDLRRDFGYGGFGGDIQGTFSMIVEGPGTLTQVKFYVDDSLLGIDEEPPFKIQFNTGSFEPGLHTLSAVGILADGTELNSNQITPEFVTNQQAFDRMGETVLPLVGLILLLAFLGTLLPLLLGKKGKQRPIGEYGPAGGAVCPKCTMPFSRHYFSPNLVFGKLERCPHCGKWSIARRASPMELSTAEDRLRADNQAGQQTMAEDSQEAKRRLLDSSRFED